MIYFCVAMHCEAKPFIDYYSMKKRVDIKRFQIFTGDRARLAITGTGGVFACCGATYLLTVYPPETGDFLFNIGAAGSGKFGAGSAVLCNRIINASNGRAFYPDMLWEHPFAEGSVASVAKPVDFTGEGFAYDLADMEAAYFFEAALFHMPVHCINSIKIVSDNGNPHLQTKESIKSQIEGLAPAIAGWIGGLRL